MRIERLEVENFRGFKERTFTFGPGMNVLVGDNGAGKTSVMRAARIALSEWLRQLSVLTRTQQKKFYSPEDVRHVWRMNASTGMEEYNPTERSEVYINIRLPTSFSHNEAETSWALRRNNRGLRGDEGVKWLGEIASDVAERRNHDDDVLLPLVAHYGVNRTRLEHNAIEGLPKWRDGYTGALDTGINLSAIERWFRDQRLVQADRGEPSQMYHTIKEAITEAIPGMVEFRYHSSISGLRAAFDSGQDVAVRHLSDGFRTTLSLLTDLVTRTAILNPSLGANALDQTPGVVLIDELDLHLHPKWQRRIANDLTRAFPNIQFITTTHSPQIISEIDEGNVYLLRENGETEEIHAYGHDASWVLRHVMDTTGHPEEIQRLLDQAVQALSDGRYDEAQQFVEDARELQEETGAIPADEITGLAAEIGSWKMMSEMENEES